MEQRETVSDLQFPIHERRPAGPPLVGLVAAHTQGGAAHVACSTCHSVLPPNLENSAHELDQFHQGLQFNHGGLSCYACHHSENHDSLRLADGSSIAYPDVMTLCSQCHASQVTSYAHGAHGGMTGFWDLSRGPQSKNNCIDCHDPHSPGYPRMTVDFKPRDRLQKPSAMAGH
jgi:hypothetical protein